MGERLGEKFASPPRPGATRRPVPCVQPIRPVTIDKPEGNMRCACCTTGLGRSDGSGGQRRSPDPHQPPKLLLPGVGQILAVDGLGIGCAGDDFLDRCQWVVVGGQPPQVVRAADARAVAVRGPAPGVLGGQFLCMTEHCSCPRRSGGTPCVSDGRPVNECWCVECPSAAVLSRCAAGERGCLLQLVPASGPRRGVIGSAARCWARLCRAHIDSPIG